MADTTTNYDSAAADEPIIGLPVEDPGGSDAPDDLRAARLLNIFGVITPAGNLGMLKVSPKEIRWIGVIFGVIFWAVGLWAGNAGHDLVTRIAFGAHYFFVGLGLIHPRWPETPARAWVKFGMWLGVVVATLMFSVVFFLVVTPMALIMRGTGRDPLRRKAAPEESYWISRQSLPTDRFERQF